MTSKKLNFPRLTLDAPYTKAATTLNVTTATKYQKGQKSGGGNDQYYDLTKQRVTGNLDQFRITIKEKGGKKVVVVGVSGVAANGTTDDGRNKYILTVETADDSSTLLHGLASDDDGTNSVNNVITANAVDSMPKGSTVEITWDVSEQNRLESLFEANTALVEETANGAIGLGKVYYLDGSALAVQGVNSGEFTGIATEAALDTANFNGALPPRRVTGIVVPGSIGDDVYADSNGDLTATAIGNYWVGNKSGSDKLDLQKRAEQDLEYDNSELLDENILKLMSDKNVKTFGLDGSEAWGGVTDDTTNVKFLDEIGKKRTLGASFKSGTASVSDLASFDGGDTSADGDFARSAFYCSVGFVATVFTIRYEVDASNYFEYNLLPSAVDEWNYFEIKKSDFTEIGSPTWAGITEVSFVTVGSAGYITISPKSLQVVRVDADTSTKSNPFQKEVSSGVFENVLNILYGTPVIATEYDKIKIAILQTVEIKTARSWKNFNVELVTSNGLNTFQRYTRLWRGGSDQGFNVSTATILKLTDTTGTEIKAATVVAHQRSTLVLSKNETNLSLNFSSNKEDGVTLDGFDSNGNVSDTIRFIVTVDNRLESFKITNTKAIVEKPKTEFLANQLAILQSADPKLKATFDLAALTASREVALPDKAGTLAMLTNLFGASKVFFQNRVSHNPSTGSDVVAHGLSGTPDVYVAFMQTAGSSSSLASITADGTNITCGWGSANETIYYGILAIKF